MTTEQILLQKYPNLPVKFKVKFALYCLNDIKYRLTDTRALDSIQTTELWVEDKATDEEWEQAKQAAYIIANENHSNYSMAYRKKYTYRTEIDMTDVDTAYMTHIITDMVYHVLSGNVMDVIYSLNILNIPRDKYEKKLLKMISNLSDMERLVYSK